jgi:hypothetical protein
MVNGGFATFLSRSGLLCLLGLPARDGGVGAQADGMALGEGLADGEEEGEALGRGGLRRGLDRAEGEGGLFAKNPAKGAELLGGAVAFDEQPQGAIRFPFSIGIALVLENEPLQRFRSLLAGDGHEGVDAFQPLPAVRLLPQRRRQLLRPDLPLPLGETFSVKGRWPSLGYFDRFSTCFRHGQPRSRWSGPARGAR